MVKNHRVVNIADHPAVMVNDRYVFAEMIQLGRFQHMFKMGVHHDQKRSRVDPVKEVGRIIKAVFISVFRPLLCSPMGPVSPIMDGNSGFYSIFSNIFTGAARYVCR